MTTDSWSLLTPQLAVRSSLLSLRSPPCFRFLPEALAGKASVAEGASTAPALLTRATTAGVELPICAAVTALLAGEVTVAEAMAQLLARPRRNE